MHFKFHSCRSIYILNPSIREKPTGTPMKLNKETTKNTVKKKGPGSFALDPVAFQAFTGTT